MNSSDKALSYSAFSSGAAAKDEEGTVPEPGIEMGLESTRVLVRGRPKDVVVVAVGGGAGGEVSGDSGEAPLVFGANSDRTSMRIQGKSCKLDSIRWSKNYLPSRSSKLSSASIWRLCGVDWDMVRVGEREEYVWR